jgi:hypothetical protein
MAHWAEIDENNVVLRVTVGSNEDPDEGYQWLIDNLGGTWVKTSYSGSFRGKYAKIGDVYSKELDIFYTPVEVDAGPPFPSWTLNETTMEWEAPIPMPNTIGVWTWDEDKQAWIN